jgi:AmmeMemoRadiSam system protein B
MRQVRQPAVAGMFYPADPKELEVQVSGFLADARQRAEDLPSDELPKALIAPHAGYIYSGPIAGSAYAAVAARADAIHRVVLLGPAHRVGFSGIAFSRADQFATPLGLVEVDRASLDAIADLPQVHALDRAFDGEHCLEVQLPFLQALLGSFTVVPLLVSDADTNDVAEVLERLWGGDETLIVISSDLSHYLDYDSARAIDTRTSEAICALRPDAITTHQACGRNPIAGLLHEAARRGLKAELLDLRSSGDTAGPRDRVVGYGAYVFH